MDQAIASRFQNVHLKIYVCEGKMCPDMRERLEKDGIKVDKEQEDLLSKICP